MNKNINAMMRQLFADNRGNGAGYRIEAMGEEATIYVYDAIGEMFGVNPLEFAQDLSAITADTVHMRINSPGGDVFGARAMITSVKEHPAKFIAHIDGIAASAATGLALAADEVVIADGSFFMIHNSWSMNVGDAKDMRDLADILDKVDDALVADYSKKTSIDDKQIRDWMDAETWFSAQESVEHGFVDRVAEPSSAQSETAARWNLAAYENTPEALIAQPKAYDRASMERRIDLLTKVAA